MIDLISQLLTIYKQVSVGTVVRHVLGCFPPRSGRGRFMLFFTPPPLALPRPEQRVDPARHRHSKTLPLHHHSRKSTVTEYPEAPGW